MATLCDHPAPLHREVEAGLHSRDGGIQQRSREGEGEGKGTPPPAPLLPPPNLAAVIKASRFVGVDELAAAFKVQTGRPVAATQLEILGMKTAEFRVLVYLDL